MLPPFGEKSLSFLAGLENLPVQGLAGGLAAVGDGEGLVNSHGFVADGAHAEAELGGEFVVGFALDHACEDGKLAWGEGFAACRRP